MVGAQGMANNAHISDDDIAQILQGNLLADVSRLVFRDPDHFRAGELHHHPSQWNTLLDDLNDKRFSEVRDWINNGVDVTKFFRLFKGSYKGKNYECSSPPPCILPNHPPGPVAFRCYFVVGRSWRMHPTSPCFASHCRA